MEHTQKETLLYTWLLQKSSSVGEDGEKPKFHAQQAVIQKKEEK